LINCVWSENPISADNRSWYGLSTLINNAMDKAELGLVHRNGFKQLPPDADGAVVVIHGGHQVSEAAQLFNQINRLSWSVTIVIGDEEGAFPTQGLVGPRRRLWVQMPIPGVHDHATRKIICGYPHDTPIFLIHCEKELREKPLGWFYAGQVNHQWRRECVTQLKMMNQGFLLESPGFWSGLERGEYYKKFASCKVAPCPAGACTPDTLRVAEALEAGCVPVVEDRWPPFFPRRGHKETSFWRYVLGEEPPFPTIVHWSDFPMAYDQALRDWPGNRDKLQDWWKGYKERMKNWLEEDVNAVVR